jgi:hypothetical protein
LALLYLKVISLPRSLDPFAPIDLADPPNVLTGLKLRAIAGNVPACVAALREVNVPVRVMPFRQEGLGCERRDTIELAKLSRASMAPFETRCDLALRLYLFERHVAQPAARRIFGGAIDRIDHFGSYSCRDIRGRAGTRSEHATANAVDLAGFRLEDGRPITLRGDWRDAGPSGQLLRELRDGACDWFNLVLSPDYNAAHEDHLHFDMGWYGSCR